MTKKEITDAIDDSLTTDQKALIAFKAADGTDLSDNDKPVKYTQKKDTAFLSITSKATLAADAYVETVAGPSVVSLMIGKDIASDGTETPNDDLKLVSKAYLAANAPQVIIDLTTRQKTETGAQLMAGLKAGDLVKIRS